MDILEENMFLCMLVWGVVGMGRVGSGDVDAGASDDIVGSLAEVE